MNHGHVVGEPVPSKRARGAQNGNANARKHGVAALKKLLSTRGLDVVDGRSELGREIRELRETLEAHVGEGRLSEPRRILIEVNIVPRILYLRGLNAWLFERAGSSSSGLVNKRKRSVIAALVEREKLAAGLTRDLETLGFDSVEVPALDLREYVATRYPVDPERADEDHDQGAAAPPSAAPDPESDR